MGGHGTPTGGDSIYKLGFTCLNEVRVVFITQTGLRMLSFLFVADEFIMIPERY